MGRFVAIVGHAPDLEREDGAASTLRGLGAEVRTLDLWEEPARLFLAPGDEPRAVVVEALDRPDLAGGLLRALRRDARLQGVGAILAITAAQVARVDPAAGFEDFTLVPYVPAELYARIRLLEWRRSEFATEERVKVGGVLIDRPAREVTVDGRGVALTAKEFSLLSYLCERRGRVVGRDELLRRVWGHRYEGGARTVDIHVRRLRAKLGPSLPLVTARGSGYKLQVPGEDEVDDTAVTQGDPASSRPSVVSARTPSSRTVALSAR